jgi:hypothetical protein
MEEEIKSKSRTQIAKEKAKKHAREFREEFNKAINTAVMAAFGFLIALVWKDVITGFVDSISSKSPVQGQLVGALVVTIICVFGIIILTKIFRNKDDAKIN